MKFFIMLLPDYEKLHSPAAGTRRYHELPVVNLVYNPLQNAPKCILRGGNGGNGYELFNFTALTSEVSRTLARFIIQNE